MRLLISVAFFALVAPLPLVAQSDASKKTAAPDANAQAEATRLIKDVYGAEWAAARTPVLKQALARKLLQRAREPDSDKPAQFVLYRMAKEMAVQAPDAVTAFEAIDELDKSFLVDAWEMKVDALAKIALLAAAPDQHRALSLKASELADAAIVKSNYPIAKQLNELAISEARKSTDTVLLKQGAERRAKIEELAKAFEEAKTALEVLAKLPLEPAANLAVGKFYCFAEGNWEKGVPMLALGADPVLKAIAEDDLKGVGTADDQAKLGDRWWEVDQKQRAAFWYRQALPGLSGLLKDKAERRVVEANAIADAEKKWLDVTAAIDPKKYTLKGEWQVAKAGIWDKNLADSHIMVPVTLGANYEIEIEFTRFEGKGEVCFIIPVGQRHCRVVLSGNNGEASGLARVNDRNWADNVTSIKPGMLENNRKYTIQIHVTLEDGEKQADITVELDGRPYLKYRGAVAALSLPGGLRAPDKSCVALGTNGSSTIFHRVRVLQ